MLFLHTGAWKWALAQSAFLAFFEATVLMAFSVAFSTFTTPILASLYTLAFFIISRIGRIQIF